MQRDELTAANRIAWDEAAPHHRKYTFDRPLQNFQRADFSILGPFKSELFNRIGFAGQAIAHVACNNGRELVALKGLGAGRCVGFDISGQFIEQARQLAQAAALPCEFVVADVYDIPASYEGEFELALVTPGTLRWMPELTEFFAAVARLLRPGGRLLVLELHPILDMIPRDTLSSGQIALQPLYFTHGPFRKTDGLDYYGNVDYASSPAYWFHHRMADVLNACPAGGLGFQHLEEFPYDVSGGVYRLLENPKVGMPLSYALVARKAG
jgi:ubiquinone/menaquinone biosynthesis C-methylase UbiE